MQSARRNARRTMRRRRAKMLTVLGPRGVLCCPRTIHVSSIVSSYYYVSFCASPSAVVASVFVAVCVCGVCMEAARRAHRFVMYIYGCTLTKKNGNFKKKTEAQRPAKTRRQRRLRPRCRKKKHLGLYTYIRIYRGQNSPKSTWSRTRKDHALTSLLRDI